MSRVTNQYIGAMCSEFRRYHLKNVTQKQIAMETGYSRESVNHFERGAQGNCAIFLWYIQHGIFDWIPAYKWKGYVGFFGFEEGEEE